MSTILTRRQFGRGALCLTVATLLEQRGNATEINVNELDDTSYPSFDLINPRNLVGRNGPTEKQKLAAQKAAEDAPAGPRPIDIANHFVDTFEVSNPDMITQWPKAAAWNPLIVEFFSSTGFRAENDLIPWCAAFANWCLVRSRRPSSGSPASQSFLNEKKFAPTSTPRIGDLAVFTCFDVATGRSVGLGHVAFVAEPPKAGRVLVIGGNQRRRGQSMICRASYPTGGIRTTRAGKPVIFRLNTYVSIL